MLDHHGHKLLRVPCQGVEPKAVTPHELAKNLVGRDPDVMPLRLQGLAEGHEGLHVAPRADSH